MDVDLGTIEKALAKIVAHLRAQGTEVVKIDDDDYWEFLDHDQFNLFESPTGMKFGVGKLSHDWERILQIASDDEHTIGYGLVWAAALLRAIGERNVG